MASRYPEEAIQAELDELRVAVREARLTLQESATERARREMEVRESTAAAERAAGDVTEALARGANDQAGESALRLEEIEKELIGRRARLEHADRAYREALDRTAVAQEAYHRRSAELAATRAEIHARESTKSVPEITPAIAETSDSIRRLERETAAKNAAADGATQAKRDLARREQELAQQRTAERRSLGSQALARFQASQRAATAKPGSPPSPHPPVTPETRVEKTIGPAHPPTQ